MNQVSETELYNLYALQGLSMKKVAQQLDIAAGTVYNYLKKYGIPTRDNKSTFTMKGRRLSQAQRRKISERMRGKCVTLETRRRMSEAKKIHGIGHKKKRTDGYVAVYYPDHEKSTKDGYVMEHILVMEKAIGRHLTDKECVHHLNGIRNDNRLENLKLMTKSEHTSHHNRERWAKKKGGMTY